MDLSDLQMMQVTDLAFDLDNPRLAEFNLPKNSTDADVIQVLWDTMDVNEIVLSIAASGFFQNEPLIVVQEKSKNVVVEGNRRLAAVRVLLDEALAETIGVHLPTITDDAKAALQILPTMHGTREGVWRYIGFKHVNGPAKWSSYAKSQYIAKVHRLFGIPLEDIARQIGDTHNTVQRLFRGMMVIEQAGKLGVFDIDDRWNRHFSSSHLYVGLGYSGIASFIGLRPASEENTEPVPQENGEQLRELFLWLYGSKKEDIPPVIQSQNPDLRRLDAVVSNGEAVAALRARPELTYAYEVSRPSSNVFEESLHAAKRDLEKARSLLSTGYDGSQQLLMVAEDTALLAADLRDEMSRKRSRV